VDNAQEPHRVGCSCSPGSRSPGRRRIGGRQVVWGGHSLRGRSACLPLTKTQLICCSVGPRLPLLADAGIMLLRHPSSIGRAAAS
jgi:hypothetical protein